jgi:hypothetical protein
LDRRVRDEAREHTSERGQSPGRGLIELLDYRVKDANAVQRVVQKVAASVLEFDDHLAGVGTGK